jgi:hypothetical protein
MVKIMTDDGKSWFHEPPYTWEEEQAIYRGMSLQSGATILHGRREEPKPQKSPPQLPEE